MTAITDLSQILQSWMRRLRLQRALTWVLHGLLAGLALALALGTVGLYRAVWLRGEFLMLVVAGPLFVASIAGLTAFLWPLPTLKAARYFDLHFRLKERLSTALELHRRPEHIPPEIIDLQLQDAVSAAQKVDLHRQLAFQSNRWEGVIGVLLILSIGLVWFRGDRWFLAGQQSRAVEQAVSEQAAQIEEILRQIEANEALSETQKEALTAPLNEALQSLQENPSLENSVSILSSTGEKMQALSDPQSRQMSQALQEAGNQLAGEEGSPLQEVGRELAQGNTVSAASKLKNLDVGELSQSEQQQLADQLEGMADTLQSSNPGLADQLRQAAEALRSGDTASAQQALQNAAEALSRAGQQVTFSQTASQTASQLQQGAGEVIAAGGGQQADQTGQQGGAGSSQSQQANGAGGSGVGQGSGTGENPTGNEAGSSPIPQDNGPGDGGETSYEQIYAPTLLGGEGGPQVDLPGSDNEGEVIGQGPVAPGDPGSSVVPYNEVYSQYEQVKNQAIESGEIPAQFTDIIKNYFDSLKP